MARRTLNIRVRTQIWRFCRAMLCISADIVVARCLSVRLSVTFVSCVKTSNRICESTYIFIQRQDGIRTMTVGLGFCSVLYRVSFCFGSCTFLTFGFSLVLDSRMPPSKERGEEGRGRDGREGTWTPHMFTWIVAYGGM